MKKNKVFIGLSGGVDSAVSAMLLKQAGYEVTGVFIKVWHPDFLECNWKEERRDAMRVAVELEIPFLFFDFEEEYKKEVADLMIAEYAKGRTPNPDVLCNRVIKFGSFWKKSKELGADFIATGHYAQIEKNNDRSYLKEGKDKNKDQSYFLWTLTKSDLSHTIFPIGHLEKSEVRKLAKKFNLPVMNKKDSQGICFMGEINLEEFLSHFIKTKPGLVLNVSGQVIGKHSGAIYYTNGERKGFEIIKKTPQDNAYYVLSKNIKKNTITVSDIPEEITSLSPKRIFVTDLNLVSYNENQNISARIRYRQQKTPITIEKIDKNLATVMFTETQLGVSNGQSIVFYQDDYCLGGGIINTENI